MIQRGSSWYAQISVPTPEGSKRETITGTTKAKVLEKLRARQSEIAREVQKPAEEVVFSDFFSLWIKNVIEPASRVSTFKIYSDLGRWWILPAVGTQLLSQVGIDQCNTLLKGMANDGQSPATRKMVRSILLAVFKYAIERQLLTVNPIALVSTPRVKVAAYSCYNAEQAKKFLESCKGDKLEAFWHIGFQTGMRRGEIVALKRSCVDLANKVIHVRATQSPTFGGKTIVEDPKTEKGRRSIEIGDSLVKKLKEHFKRMDNSGMGQSELVFCNPDGTMIPRTGALNNAFTKACKAAGLPRIRLHDMRHTHATILLMAGENPVVVSQRLGHSSVNQTLTLYGHVLPGMQASAAKRIDSLLG